jgi:hypothetical protein
MAAAVDPPEQLFLPGPSPSAVDPYIQPILKLCTARSRARKPCIKEACNDIRKKRF